MEKAGRGAKGSGNDIEGNESKARKIRDFGTGTCVGEDDKVGGGLIPLVKRGV